MLRHVMERLNERRQSTVEEELESGFTLIELMVVLLILAILLAIAIPTFLGVTKSANDRATQANLNTSQTDAENAYQSNNQLYPGSATLSGSLASAEKNLAFSTGAVTSGASPSAISVYVAADGNGVILASMSKSANCWFVVTNKSSEASDTGYANVATAAKAQGTWYGVDKNATTCSAAAVPATATFQANSFPSA